MASTEYLIKQFLSLDRRRLDLSNYNIGDKGVSELVRPEFEAGLEITRHTLHRFGLTVVEIQRILSGLRQGRSL